MAHHCFFFVSTMARCLSISACFLVSIKPRCFSTSMDWRISISTKSALCFTSASSCWCRHCIFSNSICRPLIVASGLAVPTSLNMSSRLCRM